MGIFSKRELKRLIHPHYVVNIFLAIAFILLKTVRPICSYLFTECDLDYKETEILFFTAVIIIFRTRKQGAVNILPYVGTACMLAKLGSVILFFYSDPLYGVVFAVACLLQLLLLPEPSYQGPENIIYFNNKDLEEELVKDKRIVWIVEFYAAWNPSCIDFAAHFSELSAKYGLDNLRFGKVDLSRNNDTADLYKINTSALSKQLPTVIMFKNGKEVERRPLVTSNGKLLPFSFTYENFVTTFNMNNVFKECRDNPLKTKKDKKEATTGDHDKTE